MKKSIITLVFLICFLNSSNISAQDSYLGEIKLVTYSFVPRGWAECNGQLLNISQNSALFSLLGTTYGGNGQTTFALPDLRGRVPMGQGAGPNLTTRTMGETVGSETVTLSIAQLPAHSHNINAVSTSGNVSNPSGALPAHTANLDPEYSNASPNVTMNTSAISNTGQGLPVQVMQPTLTLRYIIAIEGIYPSRP